MFNIKLSRTLFIAIIALTTTTIIGCSEKSTKFESVLTNVKGIEEIEGTTNDTVSLAFQAIDNEIVDIYKVVILGVTTSDMPQVGFMSVNGWLLGLKTSSPETLIGEIFPTVLTEFKELLVGEYKLLHQQGKKQNVYMSGHVAKINEDSQSVELENPNPSQLNEINVKLGKIGIPIVERVRIHLSNASIKSLKENPKSKLTCIPLFGGGESCSYEPDQFVCLLPAGPGGINCESASVFIAQNTLTLKNRLRGIQKVYTTSLAEGTKNLQAFFDPPRKLNTATLLINFANAMSVHILIEGIPKRCLEINANGRDHKMICRKDDDEFVKAIANLSPKLDKNDAFIESVKKWEKL